MRIDRVSALLACIVILAAAPARAGVAGLKHEKSVYADDKDGRLRSPEGVGCADDGRFVVADTGNGRLLTFTWQDGSLRGGAEVRLAQLPYPFRVQLDGAGNALVLDRKLKKIGRVTRDGAFAGYVEPKGAGAGTVVPASFRVDAAGNLYVLDAAGRRLLLVDREGQVRREIPVPKGAMFTDVALGAGGAVYAVDAVTARVWSVEEAGAAFQPLGAPLKDRVSFPTYLTSDRRGRLLVVDQHGDAIVVLGSDGSFQGRELAMGATDGLLYYPGQLCTTARGDAFVADRDNHRVQVFSMAK